MSGAEWQPPQLMRAEGNRGDCKLESVLNVKACLLSLSLWLSVSDGLGRRNAGQAQALGGQPVSDFLDYGVMVYLYFKYCVNSESEAEG